MLMKTYRIRLLLLVFMTLFVFGTIGARLYYLQVRRYQNYAKKARLQQNKSVRLIPRRGDILDRNGVTLATSYLTDNIVLNTDQVPDPDAKMIRELADLLHRPEDVILKYFNDPGRHILERKADEELVKAITVLMERYQLPPEAFVFEKSSKRVYPKASLACHVLGFTKIDDAGDNIGEAGIELKFDPWLKGTYQDTKIAVTSGQRGLEPLADEAIEATFGNNVVLTLDEKIQSFTAQALNRRCGEMQAKGGIAIVMDVKSGEILALASCPDFDLNAFTKAEPTQLKNRLLTDPIEIGSVMKIITTTLLIDRGLVKPDEMIDCRGGYWAMPGRHLRDAHKMGVVPFYMAFAESSNIGLVTVGLRLEPSTYYEGLVRFGLGQPSGIDLPGEGTGILRPLEKWTYLTRSSLPMGYETSLTAIQVIAALGAVGNGGWRIRPHLVREIRTAKGKVIKTFDPEPLERVASPETCKTVCDLMEGVITMGTGRDAKIPGFRIGGKTGTTVKGDPRATTNKKFVSSFAALMPIQNPRIAIYVYVDEPSTGLFYGAAVAAPVFREIAVKIAHILDIQPDDPVAFEQAEKLVAQPAPPGQSAAGADLTSDTLLATPTVDEVEPALPPLAADIAPPPDAKRMPNCQGMTMPEAWVALAKEGIKPEMRGSGVVVRQEPAAGAAMTTTQTATMIFALPSELLKPEAMKSVGTRALSEAQ